MNMITEGKTKVLTPLNAVRLTSKDAITAGDGAKKDEFAQKGEYATETTCNVFTLLRTHGIPVAFYYRNSPTSFIAPLCIMLPW